MNYEQIDMLEFVKSNGTIKEIKDEEIKKITQTDINKKEEKKETPKVLTLEEYEDLCQKFVNNEKLSIEELKALRDSAPILMEEKGPILRKNDGYTSISLSFYLTIFFVILCLIASGLIFISMM